MSVRQKIKRNKAKSQSFEYSPLHWFLELKKKKEIKIFFRMWTIKKKNLYWICYNVTSVLWWVFCLFVFWLFGHKTCGILAPQPGIEHAPSALKGEVWTLETPGKSSLTFLFWVYFWNQDEFKNNPRNKEDCQWLRF